MIPASSERPEDRGHGKTFATYTGQTFNQINNELKTNPNKIPSDLQQSWDKECSTKG